MTLTRYSLFEASDPWDVLQLVPEAYLLSLPDLASLRHPAAWPPSHRPGFGPEAADCGVDPVPLQNLY